jgi:hypothetical protein
MKRYSFLFHLQKEKGVTKSAMEIPSSHSPWCILHHMEKGPALN